MTSQQPDNVPAVDDWNRLLESIEWGPKYDALVKQFHEIFR